VLSYRQRLGTGQSYQNKRLKLVQRDPLVAPTKRSITLALKKKRNRKQEKERTRINYPTK
jgi:hypothetical protein